MGLQNNVECNCLDLVVGWLGDQHFEGSTKRYGICDI